MANQTKSSRNPFGKRSSLHCVSKFSWFPSSTHTESLCYVGRTQRNKSANAMSSVSINKLRKREVMQTPQAVNCVKKLLN